MTDGYFKITATNCPARGGEVFTFDSRDYASIKGAWDAVTTRARVLDEDMPQASLLRKAIISHWGHLPSSGPWVGKTYLVGDAPFASNFKIDDEWSAS